MTQEELYEIKVDKCEALIIPTSHILQILHQMMIVGVEQCVVTASENNATKIIISRE
jgi:predicted phage-related endonuclease